MAKNRPNEAIYQVLSHHIDHYIEAKKIAPKDLLSIDKAITAINKNGGVSKILKNIR